MNLIMSYIGSIMFYTLLSMLIYLTSRIIFLKVKRRKPMIKKELLTALFVGYIVGILSQTVFPSVNIFFGESLSVNIFINPSNYMLISSDGVKTVFDNSFEKSINLIPFKTISENLMQNSNIDKLINNLINFAGNLILFVPIGLILPFTDKRFSSYHSTTAFAAIFILTIEITQYFIGRVSDIDDFILNFCGISAGYLIYRIIKHYQSAYKSKITYT